MASAGPNSPSTAVNDTSVGTFAWVDPGNAAASDDAFTTSSSGGSNSHSQYLKCTGFGFSIPGGATIDGILVEVERNGVVFFGSTAPSDSAARIVKGGVIGSTNKAAAGQWPATDTIQSYGGASDLWGETWSVSDINASDFGFVIQAMLFDGGSLGIARIDHIRVTVYYTEAGGGNAFLVGSSQLIRSWTIGGGLVK